MYPVFYANVICNINLLIAGSQLDDHLYETLASWHKNHNLQNIQPTT